MPLNEKGFTIIEMPPADDKLLASFEDLPLDNYCGGKHRYRRFSQYRMLFREDHWHFYLLPHRPYIALSKYNSFGGGFYRYYEPLKTDLLLQIDTGAKVIPLDTNVEWQINVHQTRVIVRPDIPGISVPEGPHQDGHEYVMIAVFRRYQIAGAEMSLLPLGGGNPFFQTTLQAGQAVLLDDQRMFHDVSDIEALEREGHRDIVIVAFSRWQDKWYGDEFEKKALY
jgi:hypothetical protein